MCIAAGAERISSLLNEEYILARLCETHKISHKDAQQLTRFYMMEDNVIVSVTDVPTSGSPSSEILQIIAIYLL